MAAKCISVVVLVSLLEVGMASSCDGTDESCLQPEGTEKRLMQISLPKQAAIMTLGVDDVPAGCEGFVERDYTSQNPKGWARKYFNAGAVTVVRSVIKTMTCTSSLAMGAAGGFIGTLVFGMVGDAVLPDTKEKRLKAVETGLTCLGSVVAGLQRDVKNLQDQYNNALSLDATDKPVPLKDISTALRLQTDSHRDCTKLMKCVADITFMDGNGYNVAWCERHMKDINKFEHNCNAEAFQKKFVQHNDYDAVVHKDLSYLTDYIKHIIENKIQQMYPVVYLILAEYAAVAVEFYLAWSSLESWAATICHPFGNKKTACAPSAWKSIKSGLRDFQEDKKAFVNNLVEFRDKLTDADFMKTRQDSFITIQGRPDSLCHRTRVQRHRTKREYADVAPGIFGMDVVYFERDEYQVSCNEDKLKETYCGGANPCDIIEKPFNPFGCTQKKCDDWNTLKCQKMETTDGKNTKECPPCGEVDCDDEFTFELQHDHLAEHMEPLKNISDLLSSRSVVEKQFRLHEGSVYHLSPYFCDQVAIKNKFQKNCATPMPTSPPTSRPSPSPTPRPPPSPLPLQYKSAHPTELLGRCEGDCDHDAWCKDGLKCFERSELTAVPGCLGTGSAGSDYCFDPNDLQLPKLKYVAGEPDRTLDECEGDCDKDGDCKGGLVCYQRDRAVFIPGCSGLGLEGGSDGTSDYCCDPKYEGCR